MLEQKYVNALNYILSYVKGVFKVFIFRGRRKWLLLFLAGVLIFIVSGAAPDVTESVYSRNVYVVIRGFQAITTSWAGFSIAEILLFGLCAYVVSVAVRAILMRPKYTIPGVLLHFCSIAAVFCFLFVALWGINYNRLPFAETAGISVREYTASELNEVCVELINRANSLRGFVAVDEEGNVALPGGKDGVLDKSWREYDGVKGRYPTLDVRYSRPKPVLLSEVMSFAGITGVYAVHTGEANVNINVGALELPFTACHELAHQAGYAREDEANFISWLVCDQSSSAEFRYSGNFIAMIYALNSLREADESKWTQARALCSEAVNRDLKMHGQFWEKYEGPAREISTAVNDTFLKIYQQEEGVRSYGRMVDLLIAYLQQ